MELAGRSRYRSDLGNRYESLQFMQVHRAISKADVRGKNYALVDGNMASQR
jgi:hypothetical protein